MAKTYLDGTDDRLEILKMIDKSERVLSSSLKLETIQRVVNEASKEYSDVIYLGISSNLSGTAGAIRTMANWIRERLYNGKSPYWWSNH
ncbi:DegV family protein [Mycoplasmopsis cynos]|nr:DegV family protein [Mycoplasmopsis cynos]